MARPSTKTPVPEVMKFTIVVDPSLVIITTLHIFSLSDFQRNNAFSLFDLYGKIWKNNPCPEGHEFYSFGRPFLGHQYYIFSLSDLCSRVEKKLFEDIMHVHYMTYMATM